MKKKLYLGKMDGSRYGYKNKVHVEVEIEMKEDEKGREVISFVGEVRSPVARKVIARGQIQDEIREAVERGELDEMAEKVVEYWDRWHLNNLRAGCEHQEKRIREMKEEFYSKSLEERLEMMGKCPECGYEYGSCWIYEPLSDEVVRWYESL